MFRPVGLSELELIAAAGWRAFPPRFAWQPVFYPVLTREYAREIATQWNRHESDAGFAGFVTAFDVADDFAARFPVRQLGGGGAIYRELWVPAEELAAFNEHITGPITVAEAHYGPHFTRPVDPATGLPAGLPPPAQVLS